MTEYGEKTIEAAAISAGFLWPVGVTLELFAGSFMYPLAAIGAAFVAGGMQPFWRVGFQTFLRGYLAGGAVYGASVYYRTDKYASGVGAVEFLAGVKIAEMFKGN